MANNAKQPLGLYKGACTSIIMYVVLHVFCISEANSSQSFPDVVLPYDTGDAGVRYWALLVDNAGQQWLKYSHLNNLFSQPV